MLNFKSRSTKKELLDAEDIAFKDIRQNMLELDRINSLLSGHRITWEGIEVLGTKPEIYIAEIGCGGGDNLRYIRKQLIARNCTNRLTGIDIKETCVKFAEGMNPDINFICSDYLDVHFEQKPDIIFSSLFCHHFSEQELVQQVQWMKENSKTGFFINDLQRSKIAYYSIKFLSAIFSKSYLLKHDAPLSVKRGFVKQDWHDIFKKAGIQNYTIKWKWAFRFLIIFKHAQ